MMLIHNNSGNPNAEYGFRPFRNMMFCRTLISVWLLLAGGALNAHAESPPLHEYEVKAAFIYKFTKFIEWPAQSFTDPGEPFSIGILGRNPFGNILDLTFRNKTVSGREIVIKRSDRIEDLKKSHILFISSSEKEKLAEIIEGIKFTGILTVGDMDHFTESGGIIGLHEQDKKIRIQINADAAKRAGLTISSKLLILGKVIGDEPGR